jgi:hypothetical protein
LLNCKCAVGLPRIRLSVQSRADYENKHFRKEKNIVIKRSILLIGLVTLLTCSAGAQEVVLDNFPAGVSRDVGKSFFDAYKTDLQVIADTLSKYPKALAIVTGGADGLQFRKYNDALNPGLALGRAHALRSYLIDELGIDSVQILVQSADYDASGGQNRYASVRISMVWLNDENVAVVAEPIQEETVEPIPPPPPETTFVKTDMMEHFGLQLGGGLSTTPFGVTPIVHGALTWKRQVYIEGIFGHTMWADDFNFGGTMLDTKNRISGTMVSVFPFTDLPVGVIAGWVRIEEISEDYFKYVRLSEGPMIGLKATPLENLSVVGAYHPADERDANQVFSFSDNDQFLFYATLHVNFGGAK